MQNQLGEPNQWAGLATIYSQQANRRLTRIGSLIFIDSVAGPAAYTITDRDRVLAICVAAFFAHLFIILWAYLAERRIRFWRKKLAELERLDLDNADAEKRPRIAVFSDPEYRILRRRSNVFHGILLLFGIIVTAWWLAYGVTRYVHQYTGGAYVFTD
jgi:hypothetical protein